MLTIVRNRTWAFDLTIFDTYVGEGDPGNVPTNHTGWTIRSQIRTRVGNKLVANLNVTFPVPASGTVAIRHEREFTRSLATGDYWWDIVATDPAGDDHVYVEPEPIAVRDNPTDPANATYSFVPGGGGVISHTHSISDVTGLQTILDGKQSLDADLTSWAGVTRAAGFDTFTSTPSSANLRTLVTDETGTGALVFGTAPSIAGIALSGINTNSGSYSQVGGANFNVATTTAANLTATGSGTVTVSGAGGTTISGGALTISASSATFATGSIATSQPLALTQTWTNAAVTYTGLQVNVTDTASNAASLLMDLRVGGVSRFAIGKTGFTFRAATIFAGISSDGSGRILLNSSTAGGVRVSGDLQIGLSDTVLLRDGAANTLAQRNGTAAQESRIYGTYTGAGDYRRLALKMSSAGVAQIVAEGAGSGAADNRLADGNVGIGTTSPGSGLHVSGALGSNTTTYDSAAALKLTNTAGNSWLLTSGVIGVINGSFSIRQGSTALPALTIAATTNNVGIGTTSPASKLTVTGGDIEATDSTKGIILKSPNGTRYRVTISDLGILSAASL